MKIMNMLAIAALLLGGYSASGDAGEGVATDANPVPADGPASYFLKAPYRYGVGGRFIRSASTGACGGGVKDISGEWVCCTLDQRPECDNNGDCLCQYDRYCHSLCQPNGTCDQKPSC